MQNVDVRNVTLGDILYFVKLVECQNFTKTAEYFHLTQSTISKKIASLEAQTGVQLFLRHKNKRLQITPAGRHLYEQWQALPRKVEGSLQTAHVLQSGYTRSLTVAVMDSFRPEAFVMPAINGFLEAFTDVQIRIESNSAQQVRQMLLAGEADVVFSILYDFDGKEAGAVQWELFGACPHCACVRKTSSLAERNYLRVDDLKRCRFVCISPQTLPEYVQTVRALCWKYGFSPDISKYVSSASSLPLNMTADDEIFICDQYYRDPSGGQLRFIPLEDTVSGFVMAWRQENDNPFLQLFLQKCREQFQNL